MKYVVKISLFCIFIILKAHPIPTNPTVVSGTMNSDTVSVNEINFNVSDKAIINWEDFSIKANEIVNFIQPSTQAAVLNRVTSASISEIFGSLNANGKLFLINPNGVIIGENAVVDTASFLISTLNISDTDFLNNNFRFVTAGAGSIINYGTIKTKNGDVTIFGKTIENHGDIQVDGSFNVGIGEEIFLQSGGNDNILIKTKVSDATGLTNTKLIEAIKHEIKADSNPYSYAINLDGDIKKPETVQEEGKFYLSAVGGKVKISKYIKQDNISIAAQEIDIDSTALIESKNRGSIDIHSSDRMELNGNFQAPAGTITITNDNTQKACFILGEFDVSANVAGLIDINISRLYNSASLKADSINATGGTIQINSDRIIEVQKAYLSATSINNDGGNIDVFAKDNFFTSGQYIVNGNQNGGTIQISTNADILNLIASKMMAEGAQNGSILLNSNSGVKINSKTQMIGSFQYNLESSSLQDIAFTTVDLVDPNAGGGSGFGDSIVPLSSGGIGNVVVTKPQDDFNGANAGATYLYNGDSLALISTLVGNANDQVGLNGVVVLTNGNFVISSQSWSSSRGAATWGNGTSGISGTVSAANSLVGSTASDQVGNTVIKPLTNGNYVVASALWDNGASSNAGAVTWGSGTAGVSGTISNSNSLVGTTVSDSIGNGGIITLNNGNYVAISTLWNNGAVVDAGAVTWGSGTTGVSGNVSLSNSLVGSTASDQVGNQGVIALTNGNYVVSSNLWDDGATANVGAATWGNGTTGITGIIDSSNSLIGSTAQDQVAVGGVTALTNGNYVVISSSWINAAMTEAGAVTWGNGTTGTTGTVSMANSLYGTTANDGIGSSGVIALTNGNYVVSSQAWDNGAIVDAGAATWGDGSSGVTGAVSSSNSLVGTTANDQVSLNVPEGGVIALTNGNYVISSPFWNNGGATQAGAATWGDGSSGTTGAVSTSNSLYGSTANDHVSSTGVIALTNGNYVVNSPEWDNGAVADAGALTWGDGSSGTIGAVSTSNSIYGTTASDGIGTSTIPLTNGNFVTQNNTWDNGAATDAGAATWGDGSTGTTGAVSASNSLVGDSSFDFFTYEIGTIALSNGNYIILTDQIFPDLTSKGAVSFGDGSTGTFGVADSTNSLIGTSNGDRLGSGNAILLADGNYLISSPLYDDGGNLNAGAVTLGDGTNGTLGSVTSSNSVIGGQGTAGLNTIAYETVFQKAYIQFANESSGRVVVMQLPVTPTPTPTPAAAAGFSFNDEVLISNTTFSSRQELFSFISPFNNYVNLTDFFSNYIAFDIFDSLFEFKIVKIDEKYILKSLKREKLEASLRYHIRQRPFIYYLDIPKTSLK